VSERGGRGKTVFDAISYAKIKAHEAKEVPDAHTVKELDSKTVFSVDVVDQTESTDYKTYRAVWRPPLTFFTDCAHFKFRTTGSATAYVRLRSNIVIGDYISYTYDEKSTTSTTATDAYCSLWFVTIRSIYTSEEPNVRLEFRTSDSAVAAEVSYAEYTTCEGRGAEPVGEWSQYL